MPQARSADSSVVLGGPLGVGWDTWAASLVKGFTNFRASLGRSILGSH